MALKGYPAAATQGPCRLRLEEAAVLRRERVEALSHLHHQQTAGFPISFMRSLK